MVRRGVVGIFVERFFGRILSRVPCPKVGFGRKTEWRKWNEKKGIKGIGGFGGYRF